MLQASTSLTSSVLQAEAKAMLLAVLLSEAFKISRPTLLTDNKLLAKAVADRKLDSDHIHWNARDSLANILNSTNRLQARVFHIKRDINEIAHNCAHKVLRNSQGPPILRCSSSAHASPSCPILSIFKHSEWQEFVIHDVQCFELNE
jgi:hypothetical protein